MDTPTDGQSTDNFSTIPDVPIPSDTQRVSPNDVASGVGRGTQTIVGSDSSKITFGVIPGTTRLGIAQYDPNGNLVAEVGQQADGSNSFKFFDSNGVGLAQFGGFVDGETALKIAKPGIEVGSATDDQLVFNSSQDIFKINSVGSSTVIPPHTWATRVSVTNTIIHGLNFAPVFQVFVTIPVIGIGYPQEGKLMNVPQNITLINGTVSSSTIYIELFAYSDATNLYLTALNATSGNLIGYDLTPFVFKYYIQQETAN